VEERLVNEEYKIWKKNTPFLYGEETSRRGEERAFFFFLQVVGGDDEERGSEKIDAQKKKTDPLHTADAQTWSSRTPWSGRP
jgi:hypothetical protein